MSFSLTKLDIPMKAWLITSTIVKDVSKSVTKCSDSVSAFDNLDLLDLELNLQDNRLLIVWESSASDLDLYDCLKRFR